MKKLNFLDKLKQEEKLILVEPSEEISKSYLIKSDKCFKVAKLAYEAGIYENAVSEGYYSIYNIVMALFFKCGIKCENHSASVILIRNLFKLEEFYLIFSEFKKDRIDNQYYIPITEVVDKEKCSERLMIVQKFNLELRSYMDRLNISEIEKIRDRF